MTDDQFLEKWSAAHGRYGDGDFRTRVYEIFIDAGMEIDDAWEYTRRIRDFGLAFAHIFPVNEASDGSGRILDFLAALAYRWVLEQKAVGKAVGPKSHLLLQAFYASETRDLKRLNPYTLDLEAIRKCFSNAFPEKAAAFHTFFQTDLKHITEIIKREKNAAKTYSDALIRLKEKCEELLNDTQNNAA